MRLLLVEDEKKLTAFIKKGLQQEGFAVDSAAGVKEADRCLADGVYDLILLDLNLPDGNGITLLKNLRREGNKTPVLILTARDSIDEKVLGLEAGANDYMAKPFAFRELLARVRVLLRPSSNPNDILSAGDLSLDLRTRKAVRSGKNIDLTNKEFSLLELLLRHPGRPVSRVRLWEHAWDGSFEVDSNVLDVHIGRLRRKVDRGHKTSLIQTVHGTGYVIDAPPSR